MLESYKHRLRDKDEEIGILESHLDEMNTSHSYALEEVKTLKYELEHEKNIIRRFSVPGNPFAVGGLDEDNFNSEHNRSVDISERGNFMNESDIIDRECRDQHRPNDMCRVSLHDELNMLNIDANDLEDNFIYESRNTSDEFQDNDDLELAIYNDTPFTQPEECKNSPAKSGFSPHHKSNTYKLNLENSPNVNEKDIKISGLKKKLAIEKEMKESYQKKYTDYMLNYIKSEKRRKEIEIYLGIKQKQRRRYTKTTAIGVAVVALVLIIVYLIVR
jgi:hypothetical protein